MASEPRRGDDLRPACYRYINAEDFVPVTGFHREHLDPCRFCFTDGEVDVDLDDLLVADTLPSNLHAFHRRKGTGPADFQAAGAQEPSLGRLLRSDDVTSVDDLPDGLLGGDA
jgi:hypothetical protein